MSLSNVTVARKSFTIGGETFSVRGVSFDDITNILLDNEAEVEKAMDIIDEYRGEDGEVNVGAVIQAIVQKAPMLGAKLVARAAGEPEAWGNVLALPAPLQLDVLMAVGELTFTEPDSLKKFIANIASLLSQVQKIKS